MIQVIQYLNCEGELLPFGSEIAHTWRHSGSAGVSVVVPALISAQTFDPTTGGADDGFLWCSSAWTGLSTCSGHLVSAWCGSHSVANQSARCSACA